MGIFTHEIQVTNSNPAVIAGVRLYVVGLPADTIVLNADDTSLHGDPSVPRDYVLFNSTLAAGESTTLIVKYLRTGNQSPFVPGYVADLLKEVEVAIRVETDSPYPFKVGKKTFSHPLIVTNLGSAPVSAFRLYVGNLPGNVALQGQSGTDGYGIPPANLPFILIGGNLAAGESKIINAVFKRTNSNNHFIPVYRTRVAAEVPALPVEASIGGGNSEEDISVQTAMTFFRKTGILLEWEVTPEATYQVEFSEDLHDWAAGSEILTATGYRLQWFDDGQSTVGNPIETPNRYYRLKESGE